MRKSKYPPVQIGLLFIDLQRLQTTDLVLGRACLSNVKVGFWHVSERFNLHASVLGYKLVT